MQLSKALIAAGLSVAFTTACAGDRGTSSTDRSTQQQPQQSQSLPSTQTGDATTGAVPGGADAEDRTTQANEPGPGVRQGSNEGGSDRETTAEQPTATPGTGQVGESDPNDPRRTQDNSSGNTGGSTGTSQQ